MSDNIKKPESDNLKRVLDNMLKQVSNGELNYASIIELKETNVELTDRVSLLRRELKKAQSTRQQPIELMATDEGGKPELTVKNSSEIFDLLEYDLPYLTWEKPHPRVKQLNRVYEENKAADLIGSLIEGIALNLNTWVYGPTGCGKDAAIDYVSAKLNMPIFRVSCDSDITRADLVGRTILERDGTATKSTFSDGLIVKAMQQPCLLVLDEIDFMREDVAYVLQTLLNEGQLVLLEQGGRVIQRHPYCYVIATANTNGITDPLNMYMGSRQQSAAFLDRFNNWVKADYLDDYSNLIEEVSGFAKDQCARFNLFVGDYHSMFSTGDIRTPLSNRAIITICEKASHSNQDPKLAFKLAIESTVLARLEEAEYPRIEELLRKRMG